MNIAIQNNLDAEDDPLLWQVVLDSVLPELKPTKGVVIEIGRCSHWERPHQWRWLANGGFAMPMGYGKGKDVPLFDWSVLLEWTGEEWTLAGPKPSKVTLRISIPSRTKRHPQAAVHTIWTKGKKQWIRLYGFRQKDGAWRLTADSYDRGAKRRAVRDSRVAQKERDTARKLHRRAAATITD